MSIAMQHPDIESIAYANDKDQFLAVHRPRGWEQLEPAAVFASQHLGRLVRKVDDLKVEELVELGAIRRGEPIARNAKKADHVAAFQATFAEDFEPFPEENPETFSEAESAPAPQELAAAPATTK